MFDVIFALSILMSDTPVSDAEIQFFGPAIIAVAEAEEVCDKRERAYILANPQDGIEELRRRWVAFETAPHLHDCQRFPDRKFVTDHLAINRSRRAWVATLKDINFLWHDECDAEIAYLDRDYEIWDAARDSICDYYHVHVRRGALDNLRRLIGPANFYSGRLP